MGNIGLRGSKRENIAEAGDGTEGGLNRNVPSGQT